MKAPITLLVSLLASSAIAATVTLAWNLSTSPNITNQTLYVGAVAGVYTNSFSVPPLTNLFQVKNLVTGAVYHFAVSATDINGLTSSNSAEAVYTVPIPPPVPPLAPTNLHIVGP